jgi:hypothetical protein
MSGQGDDGGTEAESCGAFSEGCCGVRGGSEGAGAGDADGEEIVN